MSGVPCRRQPLVREDKMTARMQIEEVKMSPSISTQTNAGARQGTLVGIVLYI